MHFLVATWDGAGNLQPVLGLVEALKRRGHEVHVLAHDVQRGQIEAVGGTFLPFQTAPQWDQGMPGYAGDDPMAHFMAFDPKAGDDVLTVARELDPDALLVDCMLASALRDATHKGYKTVALVHALYSFFAECAGGVFRAPIDEATLALSFSYADFDSGVDFPPNLVFVGPTRPDNREGTWERRCSGKPLIVVSLSTGAQGPGRSQEQRLQTVCDALADLDVEALVTTGRGIVPESLRSGANTTLARRVAHEAVLGQADLLITHGGHGTVMAGLTLGAPMLCLAPLVDQPVNAAKVVGLGLGASIDPQSESAEIRQAVQQLLADPSLRQRSRAFAEALTTAPGLEKGVEAIEALANRP